MLYAEIKATAESSPNWMCGLANQGWDHQSYLGQSVTNVVMTDYGSAGYYAGNSSLVSTGPSGVWSQPASYSCPALATGDVFGVALNRSTGQAWFAHNNTWIGSGNPSTGSNPCVTGIPSTDMVFLAAAIYSGAGNALAIQGKSSQFTYSPPSGFSPWGH